MLTKSSDALNDIGGYFELELPDYGDPFQEAEPAPGKQCCTLCYPLLTNSDVDDLRKTLARKRIYIPTYWPEVKSRAASNSPEYQLSHHCIFLPCDQRYTFTQMELLAREVTALLHINS